MTTRAYDTLLEEILTDAYGEDEQLWAFRQVIEDKVSFPADALVIGEPVAVLQIDYDGNSRRGLTATCRRSDGSEYTFPASETVFPPGSPGAKYLGAYRQWMGLPPLATPRAGKARRPTATGPELDLARPIELAVLAVREKSARCRVPGTGMELTLRSEDLWTVVPGEMITVEGRKQWRYGGHPYLSGGILRHRVDVSALGLTPLRLRDELPWDPSELHWEEPPEDWERAILERGPRPSFEMEMVLPGVNLDDWGYDDPIVEASEKYQSGAFVAARKILMDLLAADLRCLDAHAHLGNFTFDHQPEEALRHYEVGARIGELSLGSGFNGVLPWGRLDNRPFLRCMHGYGLCLWRLERFDEAATTFDRMLWLNPNDNQGIRFLVHDVAVGVPWEDRSEQ